MQKPIAMPSQVDRREIQVESEIGVAVYGWTPQVSGQFRDAVTAIVRFSAEAYRETGTGDRRRADGVDRQIADQRKRPVDAAAARDVQIETGSAEHVKTARIDAQLERQIQCRLP